MNVNYREASILKKEIYRSPVYLYKYQRQRIEFLKGGGLEKALDNTRF